MWNKQFQMVDVFENKMIFCLQFCFKVKLSGKLDLHMTWQSPRVPNLWYAYHQWYAKMSQVVCKKSANLYFELKNYFFKQKISLLCKYWGKGHRHYRAHYCFLSLLISFPSLFKFGFYVTYWSGTQKFLVWFGGTQLKKGWEPLT